MRERGSRFRSIDQLCLPPRRCSPHALPSKRTGSPRMSRSLYELRRPTRRRSRRLRRRRPPQWGTPAPRRSPMLRPYIAGFRAGRCPRPLCPPARGSRRSALRRHRGSLFAEAARRIPRRTRRLSGGRCRRSRSNGNRRRRRRRHRRGQHSPATLPPAHPHHAPEEKHRSNRLLAQSRMRQPWTGLGPHLTPSRSPGVLRVRAPCAYQQAHDTVNETKKPLAWTRAVLGFLGLTFVA